MDHTVHLADLFRWYFGAEVVEVYAEVDNLFRRNEVAVETAGLKLVSRWLDVRPDYAYLRVGINIDVGTKLKGMIGLHGDQLALQLGVAAL
jgi:predicted dehydrogenase